MTKHLLSDDYPCFATKQFRSEIVALRRVSQEGKNRVLSSLILTSNSRDLKRGIGSPALWNAAAFAAATLAVHAVLTHSSHCDVAHIGAYPDSRPAWRDGR